MVIVSSKCKARFFAVWFEPQRCLRRIFRGSEMLRRMILSQRVVYDVSISQQAIGKSELWVASDRPVEKIDCYVPILARNNSTFTAQGGASAEIKIIGLQILRGLLPNLSLFVGGKGCLELGCDRLRELTLEREDILQFAIILLRPNLCVRLGVDELGVDPHPIAGNLHASLQHVRNTQLAPDQFHVSILAPVGCDTTAADDLQIPHFAKIGQNIVLNTIGKI